MTKGVFEVADSVFYYECYGEELYIGYPSSTELFSGCHADWGYTAEAPIDSVGEFFSRGLNRW